MITYFKCGCKRDNGMYKLCPRHEIEILGDFEIEDYKIRGSKHGKKVN